MASVYLEENGHLVLCHNFHAKFAEIDLITVENDKLHFIEVKNYSRDSLLHPLEVITRHKMNKMRRAAKVFFREYSNHTKKMDESEIETGKIIIDIVSLQPCFDLLWVRDDQTFEYFRELF